MISSNCEHVKDVTRSYVKNSNSKVIFVERPEELSTPVSKNESALIHSYYHAKFICDIDAHYIVNLQPTSPIRRSGLIDDCLEGIDQVQSDSLLTVNKITPFMWRLEKGNRARALYDYVNRPMRQDLADHDFYYHDNGNIYLARHDLLTDKMCRIGDNPLLFEISDMEGQQIDNEFDFLFLETALSSNVGNDYEYFSNWKIPEKQTKPETVVESDPGGSSAS